MSIPPSFQSRIQEMHRSLGINPGYINNSKLPLCSEPDELVDTELDFLNRPQRLTPAAFAAWTEMKSSAAADGVELFLVSAFRSIQYQYELIERKIERDQKIEDILKVNAAPGFSEHHSGRAIDIGTSACDPLVEEFEKTEAYQWLDKNAQRFDFSLSYPKSNSYGIDYEPWHWCFSP
ncbi:MAG: M15 family metallopeptidase [Gammaproteobacteria bacterium]|nr:M15 family metallopeptidase [Gammaproteobacteria bacterium]MBT3858890.1 M15 family metallopeptidase [Gammaproteobacteria bacterium]MBT3988218.1 M15 family metallopeptidase [Gammaproteobacteria bacterium]MBT4255241.1 M15 family metallopeptidase [Gammaproteobacteria bacterium]MBT4582488.1 M15 family metallopeptidase [Gammaproteobacteria bacterium]